MRNFESVKTTPVATRWHKPADRSVQNDPQPNRWACPYARECGGVLYKFRIASIDYAQKRHQHALSGSIAVETAIELAEVDHHVGSGGEMCQKIPKLRYARLHNEHEPKQSVASAEIPIKTTDQIPEQNARQQPVNRYVLETVE